ncbi:hypothetical protein BOX15_Mlig014754g2 [Macrostomum lignano]|uniref:Uncharacterized protein n=3 Tax=Macrostomum lignano TaxID=282301 RepID=A0A267E5K9_9PLAT|nr:hypothetical protein BOX15_Mlig014754g2 [Macrostomum lignano]
MLATIRPSHSRNSHLQPQRHADSGAMVEEYSPSPRLSQRGNSTVIELDIGFIDRRRLSRPSMSPVGDSPIRRSRNELSELGETLEHLTAETSKPLTVPVDEDGCPDKPGDLNVFRHPYLKTLCRARREAIQPLYYRYVVLNFRVMRRNAEMYVGYLLNQKGVRRSDLYKTKYLPIWTHCIKVRMRVNIKIGVIFHGLKSRLGLTSLLGLHFCVDGFYGVEAFGDAFGNVGPGVRPWMELGTNGSAKSLRLTDGDNIYVNVATETTRHMVQRSRPRRSRKVSTLSAVTFDVPQTMPLGQPDQLKDSGSFSPTKLAARGLK